MQIRMDLFRSFMQIRMDLFRSFMQIRMDVNGVRWEFLPTKMMTELSKTGISGDESNLPRDCVAWRKGNIYGKSM